MATFGKWQLNSGNKFQLKKGDFVQREIRIQKIQFSSAFKLQSTTGQDKIGILIIMNKPVTVTDAKSHLGSIATHVTFF